MIRPHDHPAAMRHQKTHEADQSRLRHQTSHQERIQHQVKTPKREELPRDRLLSFYFTKKKHVQEFCTGFTKPPAHRRLPAAAPIRYPAMTSRG